MNATTFGLMPTFRPTLAAIYEHMENGCRPCRTTGHPVCPEGARLGRLDLAAQSAEHEARERRANMRGAGY